MLFYKGSPSLEFHLFACHPSHEFSVISREAAETTNHTNPTGTAMFTHN